MSTWSRMIYNHLHHEPFEPDAPQWELADPSGPVSDSNQALPWMIFVRDRSQFEREFPEWSIDLIEPMMPFRYLVSGGVSMRPLSPSLMFEPWRRIEAGLAPWMDRLAMFAHIKLTRTA